MKSFAVAALLAGSFATPARAADPVPAGDFFRHSAYSAAALSPDGRFVAHGWWLEANEIDFWRRVERFLAKHLRE